MTRRTDTNGQAAGSDRQTLYPRLKRGGGSPKPATLTTHQNGAPKVRGRPFQPGHPKVGGRPTGQPNHATREVKALARRIVEDPEGLACIQEQYRAGTLAPPLVCDVVALRFRQAQRAHRSRWQGRGAAVRHFQCVEPATLEGPVVEGEDEPVN